MTPMARGSESLGQDATLAIGVGARPVADRRRAAVRPEVEDLVHRAVVAREPETTEVAGREVVRPPRRLEGDVIRLGTVDETLQRVSPRRGRRGEPAVEPRQRV